MSLLELRIALYILAMLITNGIAIALLFHAGGWGVALLPVLGTFFAIQYGRTLPRRGGTP
ncbi:hypothetical protein [Micromonospora coerulea]|uniref:hypothetical protein n=1 Tax=Micromonospora coerulea TaxID=47856 RepID=UPI001908256B|nr:hypothetical protein [Micromonospora veneta]